MRRSIAILFAFSLAACGGGGSHATPALPAATAPANTATPSSATTSAKFTITVPPISAQAKSRKPQYVSEYTQSVVITLQTANGSPYTGTPSIVATNLNASSPACTNAGASLTCTVTAPAVIGSDTYLVNTYDAVQTSSSPTSPAGDVLSTATVPETIAAGTTNTVAFTLNGVVATNGAIFAPNAHVSGSAASGYSIVGNEPYALMPASYDAAGGYIIGSSAPSITVTSGSADVSVIPSGSNYVVQVKKYSTSPVALTVTPSGFSAATINVSTVQEFWVTDPGGPSLNGFAPGVNSPIDSFAATGGPYGVAADASGNIYVADNSDGNIEKFDGTGLLDAAFISGIPGVFTLAVDASGNIYAGDLATEIAKYDSSGTRVSADYITASAPPRGLAFDSSGNFYVSDTASNAVAQYSSTGVLNNATFISTTQPGGITFDPAGHIWVVGSDGDVSEFNSAGSVLNAGVVTGVVFDFGIAIDAHNNNVYLPNTSTVNVYSSTGTQLTADTLTSGLSYPVGITVTP